MDSKALAQDLQTIKDRFHYLRLLTVIFRSLLIGFITLKILSAMHASPGLAWLSSITVTVISFLFDWPSRREFFQAEYLPIALEISGADPHNQTQAAADVLNGFEKNRLKGQLFSLVPLSVFLGVLALFTSWSDLGTSVISLQDVVNFSSSLPRLEVRQGNRGNEKTQVYELKTNQTMEIEVSEENLLQLIVPYPIDLPEPVLQLEGQKMDPGPSPLPGSEQKAFYQTLRLARLRGTDRNATNEVSVSFAAPETVNLLLPHISLDKPLARIKVLQPPYPKVFLAIEGQKQDPWPDHLPLPLQISVKGENPIQNIRLAIKASGKQYYEAVSSVVAQDKLEVSSSYRLNLEQYVEDDITDIELVAEAIDRAVPSPLLGRSRPIVITVTSAYGRYRQALQMLREIKSALEEQIQKGGKNLSPETAQLFTKAVAKSEESPFFDTFDRLQLQKFAEEAGNLAQGKNSNNSPLNPEARLQDLEQNISAFLFDHESIDDRERDRDFFVAVRALSRLVEQQKKARSADLTRATQKLESYLDERHKRWQMRVDRLSADLKPQDWHRIKEQKPFHKAVEQVEKKTGHELEKLAAVTTQYKNWIEELESKEDSYRSRQDQERREAAANARNELKILQQRQSEISMRLDRAGERPAEDLESQWAGTRMLQNTNTKATKALEGSLRSTIPAAAQRIKAAAESMEQAVTAGDGNDFVSAESYGDVAGRLLREADHAASKEEQRQRERGRRKRVSGDNYYGQAIMGGDVEIKRTYEVDAKFRGDILEDVQGSILDSEDKEALEDYLRAVVR